MADTKAATPRRLQAGAGHPLIQFVNVWKTYLPGAEPSTPLGGVHLCLPWRVHLDHRAFRLGQVDLHAYLGLSRRAHLGKLPPGGRRRRPHGRGAPGPGAQPPDRVRLPAVPPLAPAHRVRRNVELPLIYAGVNRKARKLKAMAALDQVGLANRTEHLPRQLSGGQQQRVAVARALVTEPDVLLADEPTGNLDSRSSADVLAMFSDLHSTGRTIVLITHEPDVAAAAERIMRFRDGKFLQAGDSAA